MGSKRGDSGELSEAVERLLDQAEAALDDGDFERALERAQEASELAPESVAALHYLAAAHTGLGQLEEAAQFYRRALELAPGDLDVLRGAAQMLVLEEHEDPVEALEDGLSLIERALKQARKHGTDDDRLELQLLQAIAFNKLGESGRALAVLDALAKELPDDAEIGQERGLALFELCRFAEAKAQFERLLILDERDAWARHYLGLIAEREGDAAAAARHFAKARALSPEDFPKPIELSPQQFDQAVSDALERLPPKVHSYLTNVSIAVRDLPTDADLRGSEPPLSPTLLGIFQGTPVTERSLSDPWSHFPSSIALFQKNLQRYARSRDELIEEIGVTLVHEVGHFLGLSEDDLYERGLD